MSVAFTCINHHSNIRYGLIYLSHYLAAAGRCCLSRVSHQTELRDSPGGRAGPSPVTGARVERAGVKQNINGSESISMCHFL